MIIALKIVEVKHVLHPGLSVHSKENFAGFIVINVLWFINLFDFENRLGYRLKRGDLQLGKVAVVRS